jgi:hypothetical protein
MFKEVREAIALAVLCCLPAVSYAQATDPWVTQPEVDGEQSFGSSPPMSGTHMIRCTGGATSTNPDADIHVTVSIWVESVLQGSTSAWGYQPSTSTVVYVPYATYPRPVRCLMEAPFVWVQATGTILPQCDDERTNMIEEYRAGQVAWTPACSDFANSGGSAHFSWNELNGGFSNGNPHSPWGIVKAALTTGLENTRTNYNRGGILLSSGYRCPHGNANVGGVQQSLHMHGRAADMFSADHAWTEAEFALLKQAADLTNPSESFSWSTYTDHHYHAAW